MCIRLCYEWIPSVNFTGLTEPKQFPDAIESRDLTVYELNTK